jgi:hypothetical protein
MKSFLAICLALSHAIAVSAFAIQPAAVNVNVNAPMTQVANIPTIQNIEQPSSINDYLTSSSTMVALKERPPPPTAEEIAAKKKNFNLWFWGGGFVAPFLATFYYFGLKFWER